MFPYLQGDKMNVAEIEFHNEGWKNKLICKGYTAKSLYDLIKGIIPIVENLRNDEIEDFIFRLKCYHDNLRGKKIDLDKLQEIPQRISINKHGQNYFFKLSPKEKKYSSPKSKFYCELCGLRPVLKLESIEKHIESFHS